MEKGGSSSSSSQSTNTTNADNRRVIGQGSADVSGNRNTVNITDDGAVAAGTSVATAALSSQLQTALAAINGSNYSTQVTAETVGGIASQALNNSQNEVNGGLALADSFGTKAAALVDSVIGNSNATTSAVSSSNSSLSVDNNELEKILLVAVICMAVIAFYAVKK